MRSGFPSLFRLKFSGRPGNIPFHENRTSPAHFHPPMNAFQQQLQALFGQNAAMVKALMAPIFIVMILAMMVLPLPPFALDLFFTFNIAMSLMVMMVAANMIKPLDFAAFPTVLLVTTLLRLSLNVASSRVVLIDGHTGPGAAGKVIEAFGHFLIGGNFAVGLIVFAILVVINFIVITKGAERIAEVGARFTLDAMPGKQMAIDADLNAGLIDEAEAKKRRAEVGEEADFFGSMDGASKFVRGDAIAGMLILLINVVGGFIIGVAQHNLSAGDAASTYILLAVGDALVAQIPGLLISVAAAMVVSRVGSEHDIGTQIRTQVFGSPRSLGLTAGILGLLGLVPGMPHLVFLLMAGLIGYYAYWLTKKAKREAAQPKADPSQAAPAANAEASWDDLQPVDTLGLEVGYRLIALVDKERKGDLLARIKGIRKKFAQEVGFLPPSVHIRDNLDLKPSMYRVTLRGAVVGEGEAFPGMHLAINPGGSVPQLPGTKTIDPAFGLPAVWIEERHREQAQMSGYTVVDCSTVVATHLSHLMQVNAAKLLGRVETQALVEHVTKLAPKLIEDVVPKMVGIATFQKVLQLLLDEGVHIRDYRSIIECLAEHAAMVTDPLELARRIRIHLAPAIVQQIYGPAKELDVIALEPDLERMVNQALNSPHGAVLDPGVAEALTKQAADSVRKQENLGVPACLLVPDALRAPLARLLKRAAPRLKVLAHSEIPETHSIRIGSIIGAA
jgi:flagellar biosynthesis protein FlhA